MSNRSVEMLVTRCAAVSAKRRLCERARAGAALTFAASTVCLALSLAACRGDRESLPDVNSGAVSSSSVNGRANNSADPSKAYGAPTTQSSTNPSSSATQLTAAEQAPAPASSPAGRAVALPDFTPLVKRQGPAVVNVVTTRGAGGPNARGDLPNDPFFEFFRRFAPDTPQGGAPAPRAQGLGSGFIVRKDGIVLTNAHVVADADTVIVRMADGKREFKGKVLGSDERTDVAVLKIDAQDLPVAALGDSKSVQPGQWVAAIGAPFGFANTITAGIVSATERSLPNESFVPFIQTDVAVNPGNSGGPLLNLNGEVIGINSMIYSGTGGYMGVSFAIPIDVALDVARQLEEHGKVTRGRLGVNVQPITPELAQAFGLDTDAGAVVTSVEPNSPAAKAGLRQGDVILGYNGKQLAEAAALPRLVAATKPGERATLDVWRDRARKQVAVAVGSFEDEQRASAKPRNAQTTRPANKLGLAVSELPPAAREELGIGYGLVVERAEGRAADADIQPGDIIVAVNNRKFASFEEFNRLISEGRSNQPVALLVRRGDAAVYVAIAPAEGAKRG